MKPCRPRRASFVVQRSPVALGCALAIGGVGLQASAQQSGGTLRVTPTAAASVEYNLYRSGRNEELGGEFITTLSPGVQASSRSGRVVGSISYALNIVNYSKQSEANELQNSLDATVSAEFVENSAYVDAQARISQQNLSPFGQQSTGDSLTVNDNRSEVATIAVSPYLRGRLGSEAEYRLGVTAEATNTRDSIEGDSITTAVYGSLASSGGGGARLGWSLDASAQRVDYRAGRTSEDSSLTATLISNPTYDLQLSLSVGGEANNFTSIDTLRSATWGAGVRWTPSSRTTVDVSADHRYFGRGYSILLEHRRPRSIWRFTSSRDDTDGSNPSGVGQPWSLYQLYDAQFASLASDPVARDQLVRDLLSATGQDPNTLVSGGFVSSEVRVERRDDLSLALLGRRITVNLQAFQLDSNPVDDPLGVSGYGRVRQYGGTVTLSHRLSTQWSVSLTGDVQRTLDNADNPGNDLRSLNLGWTGSVGPHASTSFGVRYTDYASVIDPYAESTVYAALSLRF